jgi:serine protease
VARTTLMRLVVPSLGAALVLGCLSAVAEAAPAEPATTATAEPTSAPAAAQRPGAYTDRPVSRLVVRMKDRAPVDRRVAAAVAAAAGVEAAVQLRRTVGGAVVVALSAAISPARAEQAARAVAARADVEWAQPDRWMYVTSDPNPAYDQKQQWNLWDTTKPTGGYSVKPASAWTTTRGSSSVVVAVVDTGITAHPDLAGKTVAGYDFVSADDLPPGSGLNVQPLTANDGDGRDADPSDPGDWITGTESASFNFFKGCAQKASSWHGTHVAGIVAAAPNGMGVIGVAPDVRVQPVRAVGKCAGSESDIADAIVWASGGPVVGAPANATPASVINLSLGGPGRCGSLVQTAITTARANGATVVAATGNGGGSVDYQSTSDPGSFPANCTGVVSVAATSRTGRLGTDSTGTPYANTGDALGQVTLSAPGGSQTTSADDGIWSTVNAGTTRPTTAAYASYVGTSMAAPHVSAAAALLQSARLAAPLTPGEVEATLVSLVQPFAGGVCATSAVQPCGSGILDLSRLAPQQVVAEPGDSTVRVSWLAPADVGAQRATGYRIERTEPDAPGDPVVTTATGATTAVTDATVVNGTRYSYRVRAYYDTLAVVLGPTSDPSTPAMPSASPEPTMPTDVTATGGIASIDVAWGAPASGAGSVEGYVVQYRRSSATAWTCAGPTFGGTCLPVAGGAATTGFTIDLASAQQPGDDYDVRVTAGTATGLSSPTRPLRAAVVGLVRSASLSAATVRPFVDGFQDTVTVRASTNVESTAEVRITHEGGGSPVRTFVLAPASSFQQVWDGTDDTDAPVAPGTYVVEVLSDDLGGSPSAITTSAPLTVTVAGSDVAAPTITPSSPAVYPKRDGFLDTVTFGVTTAVPAVTKLRITNSTGSRTFWTWTSPRQTRSTKAWAGTRQPTGTTLPDGTYWLRVTVTGANGSTAPVAGSAAHPGAIPVVVSSKRLKAVRFTKTVKPGGVLITALRGSVVLKPRAYDGGTSSELLVRGGIDQAGSPYDVLALSSSLPSTVAAKGYVGVKVTTCLRRSPTGTNVLVGGYMASTTRYAGWFSAIVDESAAQVSVAAGTIDCRTPNLVTPSVATTGGRVRWSLFNWASLRTAYVPVYQFTITGTRYTLA